MNAGETTPKQRLAALALVLATCASADAADRRFWALTPYKIRAMIAVDSRMIASDQLVERVAEHLSQRADSSIGPIWDLRVEPLGSGERVSALRGYSDDELLDRASDGANEGADPVDKLIVVTIEETLEGFVLKGVECDPLLEHVGRRRTSPPCDLRNVPEEAFRLLLEVFSPVAMFEVDRETHEHATLSFRGARLPRRPGAPIWGEPNDVLLPVLRRTDREGNVVENGVQEAPWTYFLFADDQRGSDLRSRARIYSHTKRPFGTRRRGRVDHFAILLRRDEHPTKIHLHVRQQPDEPLAGYQAYVQDGDNAPRELLGVTNDDGVITVERGAAPIQIVFIKSGSQLVAKAPTPVGAVDQIDIPLPDERKRLEAEAKLGLLREELIDLIARRSILAARIRDDIRKGEKQRAREMLNKLDGMPGRAQFSLRLNRVKQQSKSDDPQVQARIDKLFNDTAIVLSAFLGTGEVNKLRRELAAAE